ncbi:MAG: two-component regulator propeller domain-containing protein [Daejeonella sp.]
MKRGQLISLFSLWFISFTFLFYLPLTNLNAQTLNFKNYGILNGLANSRVYYTFQDSRGFLWFATESGVNRFDGKNFELFTMNNGLSDNEVFQINEDSKGRIWFLTLNGNLSYFYQKKIYNSENDKTLKKAVIKASYISFFEDANHRLWLGTSQQQIVMIDDDKVTFYNNTDKKEDIANSFIMQDSKQRIWIVNKKIYSIKNNKFIPLPHHFPASIKACKYNRETNTLLFVTKEGLMEIKEHGVEVIRKIPAHVIKTGLRYFFIDRNENLWATTLGNGIYLFRKGQSTPENYLYGKFITHAMEDEDGNIWISTIGDGVFMLPRNTQNIIQYNSSAGLGEDAIHSIAKHWDGRIILGLRRGCLNFISDKKITYQSLKTSTFSYNPIKKIYTDPQTKTIWFASDNAVGEIKGNKIKGENIRFLKEKHDMKYAVKSFSISKSGKIAFAMSSGVYILENKNSPLIFTTNTNLLDQPFFADRAFTVYYDSKDRLWFCNINGLFRYSNGKLDTISKSNALLAKRVTDILELPDGSMVLGSYGFGAIILKDDKIIRRITAKNGLNGNICYKLALDENYFWVATNKGVNKVKYAPPYQAILSYRVENGLISNEVNDILVEKNHVYIATNNGLTVLSENTLTRHSTQPKFYITNFKVNDKPVDSIGIAELNYDQNNIAIQFTSINFNADEKVLYRYRTKDSSPWRETYNNSIEFSSLEPGNYRFSISAKRGNSEWTKSISIPFVIKSPFWLSWWYNIIIIIIISVFVITVAYLFFKRQRQAEERKLLTQNKIIVLEQQALQAMMNPHFVFNVMNSIQHFINNREANTANQILTGFARLIRKNLEICTKRYITLEEELTYLKLYLSLERMRFSDKMKYYIIIDKSIDIDEILIPSMLLQPFIENAIWHGIMPKEEGGSIKLKINYPDILKTELQIEIVDDGIGIANSQKIKVTGHVSRGMQLTQERINLLNKSSKQPITIKIEQNNNQKGTRVLIKIPVD